MKRISEQLSSRFSKKFFVSDSGCHIWTGSRTPKGYGQIIKDGRLVQAHRAAYFLTHGEIPPGMYVCHKCDTPPCVNPDHLFLGTPKDNTNDKMMKGRHHWGERSGLAKLTWNDVDRIRAMLAAGMMHKDIAKEFGVSRTSITHISTGETWAYRPPNPASSQSPQPTQSSKT